MTTDQELLRMSLYEAFEALRTDGCTEADAIERISQIALISRALAAYVAKSVYRPHDGRKGA